MTPTREQIVATIVMAKYGVPNGYRSGETYKIADALLREYEISTKLGLPESDGGSRAPSASSGKRQIQSGAKSEITVKEEKNV